jgi:hypothetical protein
MRVLLAGLGLALVASTGDAQSLGARVAAVRSGTVRFAFPAADGVCGNGRGDISVRRGDGCMTTRASASRAAR